MILNRWRLNLTFWMIKCATSVRVLDVEANSRLSSAPTLRVYNTTVSTAGPPSTLDPDESSTSHSSRRALTDPVQCPSGGAKIMHPLARSFIHNNYKISPLCSRHNDSDPEQHAPRNAENHSLSNNDIGHTTASEPICQEPSLCLPIQTTHQRAY